MRPLPGTGNDIVSVSDVAPISMNNVTMYTLDYDMVYKTICTLYMMVYTLYVAMYT